VIRQLCEIGRIGKKWTAFEVQAKSLSYLTHRDPWGRHGCEPQKAVSLCLPVRSLALASIDHDRRETPATIV